MPQISVNGLDAYYRDEGTGVPVVLGHGSAASSGQWRDLIKRMSGRYRLVAPDHIGYGRTAAYSGDIPLMEHEIAIVEALVRLLSQPVHMVGHSYGGSVLTRVAIRMPEQVRSLTLVEPTLFYLLAASRRLSEHTEIKAIADRVIRYIGENDADEAARSFIEYWVGPRGYDAMEARSREAVRASIAKLPVEWPTAFEPYGATVEALSGFVMPIQLIGGSRTTPAARGVIDVLRGLWPRAAYAEIEGAGHMAPVTHADTVNEIIDTFIGRVAGSICPTGV
jgi:pimeloyl-ACP methyl ester carboxylesterase